MPTPVPGDLTAGTVGDEFLDLICNDLELLRVEFEAIVAAEWPSPPKLSGRGPTRARPVNREAHRPVKGAHAAVSQPRRPGIGGSARQRSPPPRRQPLNRLQKGR